jgi:cation transport regulator ChaC
VNGSAWIFGYGSLVSPTSMAATIGRTVAPGDTAIAHLDGYGRRWNYGSMHLRGDWHLEGNHVRQGLVVSLGIVRSDTETCNGRIVKVTDDELAMLDWRERDYERTDVSDVIRLDDGGAAPAVWTYVPRASAIERYLDARDRGRAAVRRSYWELVDAAFGELGSDHRDRYAATPAPDVPVVDITLSVPRAPGAGN